jgi:Porin PorA
MRSKRARWWGIGLAVLGVLCLVAAAILTWVVVPNKKQLPADTDTIRHFTGTGKLVLDP